MLPNIVNPHINSHLLALIMNKDVKVDVFDLEALKALGSDGFSSIFYQ